VSEVPRLRGWCRRAAEEPLDQLDWCVDSLYRIGKPEIAKANREEPVDDPPADARRRLS
jgi:hypothetical protein